MTVSMHSIANISFECNVTRGRALSYSSATMFWVICSSRYTAVAVHSLFAIVLIMDYDRFKSPYVVYLLQTSAFATMSFTLSATIDTLGYTLGWSALGNKICTLFLYVVKMINGCSTTGYQLIAVSRFWAACSPLTYRRYHTKRVAWLVSGAAVLYFHFLVVPAAVVDAALYRLPLELFGCRWNMAKLVVWDYVFKANGFLILLTLTGTCGWLTIKRHTLGRLNDRGHKDCRKADGVFRVKPKASGYMLVVLSTAVIVLAWAPTLTVPLFIPRSALAQEIPYAFASFVFALSPFFFAASLPELRAVAKLRRAWRPTEQEYPSVMVTIISRFTGVRSEAASSADDRTPAK